MRLAEGSIGQPEGYNEVPHYFSDLGDQNSSAVRLFNWANALLAASLLSFRCRANSAGFSSKSFRKSEYDGSILSFLPAVCLQGGSHVFQGSLH